MFKSIVTGTDGSPEAERALELAVEIAKADPDVSVHVVAAFDPLSKNQFKRLTDYVPVGSIQSRPNYTEDPIATHARIFMAQHGIKADVEEVLGDPGDVLLAAAERHRADLLIVGCRGEGVLKRALHGSISTRLVHHAPCPVMVVRDST